MRRYTLIGNPVAHSLSPQIHKLFATQFNIPIEYTLTLAPLEGFAKVLKDFTANAGKGVNVTVPFKAEAITLMDSISETAAAIGAINTVIIDKNGKLHGENTDSIGFLRDVVQQLCWVLHDKSILILGTGGAALAILFSLISLSEQGPKSISVANVVIDRAQACVKKIKNYSQKSEIAAISFCDLKNQKPFDIVINATSAGVKSERLNLPTNIVSSTSCVYDLAYGNAAAEFKQWAELSHVAAFSDGIGMLIEQAAEAFYLWLGLRPDVEQVKRKLSLFRN